jgi:hypothetical protein
MLTYLSQQFFFEKKNQKTSTNRSSLHPGGPQPKRANVFCFFFSKEKTFATSSGVSRLTQADVNPALAAMS